MKNIVFSLMLLLASAGASAGVLGFDDLPGDETEAIANGYQGFHWYNLGAIRADAYPDSGYAAGTVSFANTAFNRDGGIAAISKAGGFNFAGAWFTSAWLEQELAFDGWRDGQLLYSTTASYVLDTVAPVWVGLGWSGIDTLVIYNSSGTQWAMDDFTVPEPASLGLFATALVVLTIAQAPDAGKLRAQGVNKQLAQKPPRRRLNGPNWRNATRNSACRFAVLGYRPYEYPSCAHIPLPASNGFLSSALRLPATCSRWNYAKPSLLQR